MRHTQKLSTVRNCNTDEKAESTHREKEDAELNHHISVLMYVWKFMLKRAHAVAIARINTVC